MKEKIGRKLRYGEPTEAIRVPRSMIPLVQEMLDKREVLEAQWQAKQIGPHAQKLVDLIVESVLAPQRALIEVYEKSGRQSFIDEAAAMKAALDSDRLALSGSTTYSIIKLLLCSDES